MIERCKAEVLELHQFFEDWFNAVLPRDEHSFGRFSGVLDPEFQIIAPSARISNYEQVTKGLREAYGSWQSLFPRMHIYVKKMEGRFISEEYSILTYEEWQGPTYELAKGRRSTAVFRKNATKPQGVEWLHVHETWL